MEGRNSIGIKNIILYLVFLPILKAGIKISPQPGRNPWPRLIDSTWRKIRPKNSIFT
tara:strand:- start:728 stop:898 length:171 start_codon:yes stop_codon:yes gene_type:complete